jgi:hypothetical protein
MEQLRQFIIETPFQTPKEEIQFFKHEKPKFQSKLIFYLKVFRVESGRPAGSRKMQKKYLEGELKKADQFFSTNREFCQYVKSGSEFLDEQYFTRSRLGSQLNMEPHALCFDPLFHSSHDFMVAELYAFERLCTYLSGEIVALQKPGSYTGNPAPAEKKITWTASKAALIELIYALHASGAYNNGQVEVKEIADHFEHAYNLDLGNYYRSFQELRIRKKSRTSFMDQLKERLESKMDEADECPRF